jgi:hypothetical protein
MIPAGFPVASTTGNRLICFSADNASAVPIGLSAGQGDDLSGHQIIGRGHQPRQAVSLADRSLKTVVSLCAVSSLVMRPLTSYGS